MIARCDDDDDPRERHDRLMIGRMLVGLLPVESLTDGAVYSDRARDILRMAREIPPTDDGLPDLAEIAGRLESDHQYGAYIRSWLLDVADDAVTPRGDIDECPGDETPSDYGNNRRFDSDSSGDTGDAPPEDRPRWQPFPVGCLPEAVGRYVEDAAGAIGCDPSLVALPLLTCLARAIGNRRVVQIKDSWTEPAVFWSAVVAKSGSSKTPAFDAATRFIESRQQQAIKDWQEAREQYKRDVATYERDYNAWKRSKDGGDPPEEPVPPACETFYTADTTIEGLVDRLDDQYDGIAVLADELSGWINSIAQYKGGKGADLGHWLSGWSARAIKQDRKATAGGKKILYCPRAAISITGGIQPDVLRDAIGREHRQNGLCARLLLACPPPRRITWTERTVSPAVVQGMATIFDRLFALAAGIGADGLPCPIPVGFDPVAKSIWVERYNTHRAALAELNDDLAAAWAKLEAYTARLALLFALCDCRDEIDADSVTSAITLVDWFGNEAKRVYGLFGESDEDREQRELVDLIARRGGRITERELRQSGPRRYRGDQEAVEAALQGLVDAELARWEHIRTDDRGGRPTRVCVLASVESESKPPESPQSNKVSIPTPEESGDFNDGNDDGVVF